MTAADRIIRWTTAGAVVGVAAVAAVASYEHAYALVQAYGESGWTGRLIPLTVDGLIYASSMVMLDSARRGVRVPALARWLLGLGIVATLAANVAHGLGHGIFGSVVAAWPTVALVGKGCRLRHLRAVLPCEVRVLGGHPLAGCTLMASWFKHIGGVLVLGVELPDGSAATVPAAVTDVFGAVVVQEAGLVLDADGLRGLRALAARLLDSVQGRPAGAGR